MKKKLFAIGLILVIALFIVGCSGSKVATTPSNGGVPSEQQPDSSIPVTGDSAGDSDIELVTADDTAIGDVI